MHILSIVLPFFLVSFLKKINFLKKIKKILKNVLLFLKKCVINICWKVICLNLPKN